MRTLALVLALGMLAGCGGKMKRLSGTERDHLAALRVYMNDDAEKEWLKLKTEAERDEWLHVNGVPGSRLSYWEQFYQYDAEVREAILGGDVQLGWTEDKVFMSWGQPYERRRLTGRPASRSELFIYRFEVDRDGIIRVWEPSSTTAYKAVRQYQMDVFIDDNSVTDIIRKDVWE